MTSGDIKIDADGVRIIQDDGDQRVESEDNICCCGCWKIALLCVCPGDIIDDADDTTTLDGPIPPVPTKLYVPCPLITEDIVFKHKPFPNDPNFKIFNIEKCYSIGPDSEEVASLPSGVNEVTDISDTAPSCGVCCDPEACCLPDETCTDELTHNECLNQGGVPQGIGSKCTTLDCKCCPVPTVGGGFLCHVSSIGSSVQVQVKRWKVTRRQFQIGGQNCDGKFPGCLADCSFEPFHCDLDPPGFELTRVSYIVYDDWTATCSFKQCFCPGDPCSGVIFESTDVQGIISTGTDFEVGKVVGNSDQARCCGVVAPEIFSATVILMATAEGISWGVSRNATNLKDECEIASSTSICSGFGGFPACPPLDSQNCNQPVSVICDTGCLDSPGPDGLTSTRVFCQISIIPNLTFCSPN